MVPNHSMRWMLGLAILTISCRLFTPPFASGTSTPLNSNPQPATNEATVPAPTSIPSIPPLTAAQIRNAQYQVSALESHPTVQLVDGKYLQGTDTPDFISITLTDFIALGDIDGDGVNEAAAIFFENFGGTGNFGVLALYKNNHGVPVFVTSTLVDDRPKINGLSFEGNEIYLDAVVHGFEDPDCCPGLPTTRLYAFVNNQLRITHFTTATPIGSKREIVISSPADGVEVSDSVQVRGDVTIAPFENTLALRIYSVAGNELRGGPVQVIAPDLGSPGKFDTTVDLTGIPTGTTVFIELQDLSAADGSLMAMDSVELVVK